MKAQYLTIALALVFLSVAHGQVPGKCSKRVKIKISFVADDGVTLWICGVNVRQASNFGEMQSFTYENACDDFMIEVFNERWSAGVALLAEYNGQKYGTTDLTGQWQKPGVGPLFAIAKKNPTGNWRSNPTGYPFFDWTPTRVVTTLFGTHPNFDSMISQGAYPINVQNGNVDRGTYGLKLSLPSFCS